MARTKLGVVGLLITLLTGGCGGSSGENNNINTAPQPIQFVDPNLEECAREALGRPTGDLFHVDVVNLTWLECQDRQIESISGLEHFVGLTHLSLFENDIADLSPLAGLTRLEFLQLGVNRCFNLYPLAELVNLRRLGLQRNSIDDLTPLEGLINLEWLNLDNNRIEAEDLQALSGLTSLEWLTLEHNGVESWSALDALESAGCEIYGRFNIDPKSRLPNGRSNLALGSPGADKPVASGRLSLQVEPDGAVTLKWNADGKRYPVRRHYAGRITLAGDRLVYRDGATELTVGELRDGGFDLCTGPWAAVCRLAVGRKSPTRRAPTLGLDTPAEPIFSAMIRLRPARTKNGGWSLVDDVFGESNTKILPYVLASPNQFDAGSCLFMAVTGGMEILMNQRLDPAEIEYEGDTDLSERYLMNASDHVPSSRIDWVLTDVLYTYNYFNGSLLNNEYRFTAGYVKDTSSGGKIEATASDPDAYFSCYYNWFDHLPSGWQEMVTETPESERTVIFVDPARSENSQWNVALMDDSHVEKIKHELQTKNAPVVVVFNYYLYWHTAVIVGFDDSEDSRGCPMVESMVEYFEEEGATSYVDKIEQHMAENHGCTTRGIFYVRDSIYDGDADEIDYSYSDEYSFVEKYSDRIVTYSYNWIRYVSNHVYTMHRN